MQDREVVAAVVAGDPAGLAEAYDRYAPSLYTYCRTLLREPSDAADAVQDTFVIAAAKLSQLRDPDKLRTWLYAVARNECHRRLRQRSIIPGLDEMPEPADEAPEVGADAERAELRKLVRDALTGLNIGDREVIELNLRHEFEGLELAEALGVSRNHAHAMLSRARNQLKTSLGALLVARSGRQSCEVLDTMLANWDGEMTVLLRKQVNRHIDNCDICGERRNRELAPAALFSLLPVVAALPRGLREHVLRLCADTSPQSVQYRQEVTQHAGSFGPSGFPAAAFGTSAGRWHAARRGAMIATPAAVVLIIAAVVFGALGANGTHPANSSAGGLVAPVVSVSPGPATSVSAGSSQGPTAKPAKTAAAAVAPGPATAPSTGLTSSPASGKPKPARSASPSPSRPPSRSPTPSPTPTPAPSPTPSPAATTGTLAVSTASVTLVQGTDGGPPTGTFTLTAVGGSVPHYWIVISVQGLTASPSSGGLADGGSVTIRLTWSSRAALSTQILINPGEHPVSVVYTPAGGGGGDDAPTRPPAAGRPDARY